MSSSILLSKSLILMIGTLACLIAASTLNYPFLPRLLMHLSTLVISVLASSLLSEMKTQSISECIVPNPLSMDPNVNISPLILTSFLSSFARATNEGC